jgi:hypothetical protein
MKRRRTRLRKKPAPQTKPAPAATASRPDTESIILSLLLDSKKQEELAERIDKQQLQAEDHDTLVALIDFHLRLAELVGPEGLTEEGLCKLIDQIGESTEGVLDDRPNGETPHHDDSTSGSDA